jgi:hypothetical protein
MTTELDVERELRSTLELHANEARPPAVLGPSIRCRRRVAARQRAVAVAATAAAVVAVAALSAALLPRSPGSAVTITAGAPADGTPWTEVGTDPTPVTAAIRAEAQAALVSYARGQRGLEWARYLPAGQVDVQSAGTLGGAEYYLARARRPAAPGVTGRWVVIWFVRTQPGKPLTHPDSLWVGWGGGGPPATVQSLPSSRFAVAAQRFGCPTSRQGTSSVLAVFRSSDSAILLSARGGAYHRVPRGTGIVLLVIPDLGVAPDPVHLRFRIGGDGPAQQGPLDVSMFAVHC